MATPVPFPSPSPPPQEPATSPRKPAPDSGEAELERYLRVLIDRKWVILLSLALGAGLFWSWARKQVPIYQASATIIVAATPPQVMGGDVRDVVEVGPGQYWQMQDYIQTQRRVLTSDSLAASVVGRLKLLGDDKFWGGGVPQDAAHAAQAFVDAVSADAVPDTQIITVSYKHRDPAQAKRAVDGLCDTYVANNEAWRDSSNASASTWLAKEADTLRKQLGDSELALYEFKRKNDLLSVSLEEKVNNVGRLIDKLSDALTEARLRRVARAAESTELDRMAQGDPDILAPAVNSLELDTLRTQLIDEQRRLSELRARYEEPHPLVRQQAAKVDSMKQSLARETQRLLRGAQARSTEATEQEQKIAQQLEAAKQEGLRINRLELDYNKLKRENEALGKQYQQVNARAQETGLAAKIKGNNLHVLDYARLPTVPISPHLTRSAVVASLIALLVGVLLALAIDALDRTVKSQEDVEQTLGLPLLGVMPRLESGARSELYVAEHPSSVAAECCRVIRTNLAFAGLKRPLKRLLVTSSLAREGKTLTTVSLGATLAQAGQRVLLVECDLRKPRLRPALGLEAGPGLTNVLLGEVTLDEAIRPTGIPNLSVLLAGSEPPNPAEVIEGARFRELLDQCNGRFERVVIDSPPSLPVTDPAILAGMCDGVVIVLRSGRTGITAARRTRQTMDDLGARLLGAVLNDCDLRKRAYGQRYGYGYGYGYGRSTEPRLLKKAV